jgi:hypothetical protein
MKKTSILIPEQIPAFVQELYAQDSGESLFILFMQTYYEWMEETKGTEYFIKNIESGFDVDEVFSNDNFSDFRKYFFSKFLHGIPQNILGNKKLFIKHSRDFFLNKGNNASYKFLFKILYNEDIEFFIPHTKVLTLSDSVKGKVSEDYKIHDSNYWQQFSYEIISEKVISEYRDIVSKILHPAGMKMFGKFKAEIEDTERTRAIISTIESILNIVIELNRRLYNSSEIEFSLRWPDIEESVSNKIYTDQNIPAYNILYGSSSGIQSGNNENLFDQNFLIWSEDFSNAAWVKSNATVAANFALAPDGTFTANRIVNSSGSDRLIRQEVEFLEDKRYSFSVWLRTLAKTPLKLNLVWNDGTVSDELEVIATAEWQRFSFEFMPENTATGNIYIHSHPDEESAEHSFLAWGAQLSREIMLPYVKTEAFSSGKTNLIIDSADITKNSWVRTNVDVEHTNEYDEVLENNSTAGSIYSILQRVNGITSTGNYVLSTYLQKQGSAQWVRLYVQYSNSGYFVCWFDLENGVKGTENGCAGTIEDAGNGFYRCTIESTAFVSSVSFTEIVPYIEIRSVGADNGTTKTGSAWVDGFRIYGTQFFRKSLHQRDVEYLRADSSVNYSTVVSKINLKPLGLSFPTDTLNGFNIHVFDGKENLLTNSELFSVANWIKSNVTLTDDDETSPTGTGNATKVVCNNSTSSQSITQALNWSAPESSDGGFYVGSVYVLAGSLTEVKLLLQHSGVSFIRYLFDLDTQTVTYDGGDISATWKDHGATIEDMGGGWLRCSVYGYGLLDSSVKEFVIVPSENGGQGVAGDGSKFFHIWGAQVSRSEKNIYTVTEYNPYISNRNYGGKILKFENNGIFLTVYVDGHFPNRFDNTMEYIISKSTKFENGVMRNSLSESSTNLDLNESDVIGKNLLVSSNGFYRNALNTSPFNFSLEMSSLESNTTLVSLNEPDPAGGNSANLISFDDASSYRYKRFTYVMPPIGDIIGIKHTVSVWLWSPNKTKIGIRLANGTTGEADDSFVTIDLTNKPTRYLLSRTFGNSSESIDFGLENRASILGGSALDTGDVYVWNLELLSGDEIENTTNLNSGWRKKNVTCSQSDNINSPYSISNEYSIYETVEDGEHYLEQGVPGFSAGRTYNFSGFMKSLGNPAVDFYVIHIGEGTNASLVRATISGTPQINNVIGPNLSGAQLTDVGDDWYRISFNYTPSEDVVDMRFRVALLLDSSTASYTGNTSRGIALWNLRVSEDSQINYSELEGKEIEIISGVGRGQTNVVSKFFGYDNFVPSSYQIYDDIRNLCIFENDWNVIPNHTSVYKVKRKDYSSFFDSAMFDVNDYIQDYYIDEDDIVARMKKIRTEIDTNLKY